MERFLLRRAFTLAFVIGTALLLLLIFPPTLQPAVALGNPCGTDPANLIVNGSMAAAYPDEGVAAYWHAFVLQGGPDFEHVNNEQIDPNGSQYIWEDIAPFDAGIYQTVGGLAPGHIYHFWLGWALAAYDPGTTINERGNWIGRQVGVDPAGGTDPRSGNVIWGSVYWDGIAAVNIPALDKLFTAQSDHATIFLRVINTSSEYRNKAWLDSVCMEEWFLPNPPHSVFLPMISAGDPTLAP